MPDNQNSNQLYPYKPAVLKRTSIGWHVEYYALHPQTKCMERKQIKLNSLRKRYKRQNEFKNAALNIVCNINAKLCGGWSPFLQSDNIRLYTNLTDVTNEYITEKKRELRENSIRSYASFIRIFLSWCNNNTPGIYASVFNKVLAIKYMDYVYNVRKVEARAWNNQLKMARAFFSWAQEKCYVKENPFENIKPKRNQQKKRILIPHTTRAEIAEYFNKNDKAMLLVCHLVFSSLIRPKEISLIKISDISIAEKRIYISANNAKNHHERFAPISAQIITDLINLKIETYPQEYYLFSINSLKPGPKNCNNTTFTKKWDTMRKHIMIPAEMQLYSLRDTGINNMLKANIDPLTVMQAADHHDLSMTTRYANHADSKLMETIYTQAPSF